MNASRPNLSKYVMVGDASARTDRIWLRVSDRLDPRRGNGGRRVSWMLASAVTLIVGLVAGVFVAARRVPSGWAQLETAGDVLAVQLQDGSRLRLERQTRLELRESSAVKVMLELQQGHVDCDVTPNRRRTFAVGAGGFEVLVSGTQFGVELSPQRNRLEVDVRGGEVSVHRRGESDPEAVLHTGQRWSIELQPSARTRSPASAPSHGGALAVAPEMPTGSLPELARADAGLTSVEAPPATASPSTEASLPAEASDVPSTRQGSAKPRQLGARMLLDRGNAARREGDYQGAARTYARLLSTYPSDPRAGLAAFELGCLRMDRLGDLRGAIVPLQTAAKLLTDPGLREDAMARLVRAFDALGEADLCLDARGVYLENHPTGVHVNSVAESCDVNEKR